MNSIRYLTHCSVTPRTDLGLTRVSLNSFPGLRRFSAFATETHICRVNWEATFVRRGLARTDYSKPRYETDLESGDRVYRFDPMRSGGVPVVEVRLPRELAGSDVDVEVVLNRSMEPVVSVAVRRSMCFKTVRPEDAAIMEAIAESPHIIVDKKSAARLLKLMPEPDVSLLKDWNKDTSFLTSLNVEKDFCDWDSWICSKQSIAC